MVLYFIRAIRSTYLILRITSYPVRFGHRTTTCAFFSWKLYFYFLKHLLLVR
jgi:hypothetical protein